jgi:hypothetical protein
MEKSSYVSTVAAISIYFILQHSASRVKKQSFNQRRTRFRGCILLQILCIEKDTATECVGQQLTVYSMYTGFITCVNSIDPDQLAHPCYLIRIYTVCFLVRNSIMNQNANSVDPDQMARVFRLLNIWDVGGQQMER